MRNSGCVPRHPSSRTISWPRMYSSCFSAHSSASSRDIVRETPGSRSEEHTSELQSRFDLVWRLLLEKKKCEVFGRVVAPGYALGRGGAGVGQGGEVVSGERRAPVWSCVRWRVPRWEHGCG